jgi:hypothetical protein
LQVVTSVIARRPCRQNSLADSGVSEKQARQGELAGDPESGWLTYEWIASGFALLAVAMTLDRRLL